MNQIAPKQKLQLHCVRHPEQFINQISVGKNVEREKRACCDCCDEIIEARNLHYAFEQYQELEKQDNSNYSRIFADLQNIKKVLDQFLQDFKSINTQIQSSFESFIEQINQEQNKIQRLVPFDYLNLQNLQEFAEYLSQPDKPMENKQKDYENKHKDILQKFKAPTENLIIKKVDFLKNLESMQNLFETLNEFYQNVYPVKDLHESQQSIQENQQCPKHEKEKIQYLIRTEQNQNEQIYLGCEKCKKKYEKGSFVVNLTDAKQYIQTKVEQKKQFLLRSQEINNSCLIFFQNVTKTLLNNIFISINKPVEHFKYKLKIESEMNNNCRIPAISQDFAQYYFNLVDLQKREGSVRLKINYSNQIFGEFFQDNIEDYFKILEDINLNFNKYKTQFSEFRNKVVDLFQFSELQASLKKNKLELLKNSYLEYYSFDNKEDKLGDRQLLYLGKQVSKACMRDDQKFIVVLNQTQQINVWMKQEDSYIKEKTIEIQMEKDDDIQHIAIKETEEEDIFLKFFVASKKQIQMHQKKENEWIVANYNFNLASCDVFYYNNYPKYIACGGKQFLILQNDKKKQTFVQTKQFDLDSYEKVLNITAISKDKQLLWFLLIQNNGSYQFQKVEENSLDQKLVIGNFKLDIILQQIKNNDGFMITNETQSKQQNQNIRFLTFSENTVYSLTAFEQGAVFLFKYSTEKNEVYYKILKIQNTQYIIVDKPKSEFKTSAF